MKNIKVALLICIFLVPVFSYSGPAKSAVREVKTTIINGYIKGVFLEGDVDLIKKNWHEDCDIVFFNPKDRTLQKGSAVDYFTKYFESKPGPLNENIEYEFKDVQVSGYAAVATVEIRDKTSSAKIYTDFLSLYKFKNGWKIVSKTFYAFPR